MPKSINADRSVPWLALALSGACITLVFQLFPPLFWSLVWAVDLRNWTQSAWFCATIVGLCCLLLVRFGPDLISDLTQKQEEKATKRADAAKIAQRRERRKQLERIKESRKRRLY